MEGRTETYAATARASASADAYIAALAAKLSAQSHRAQARVIKTADRLIHAEESLRSAKAAHEKSRAQASEVGNKLASIRDRCHGCGRYFALTKKDSKKFLVLDATKSGHSFDRAIRGQYRCPPCQERAMMSHDRDVRRTARDE
jgi:hypothetical protein